MATYTENLNLKLPAGNENVSRQDLNANMEAIDSGVLLKTGGTISGSLLIGTLRSGTTMGTQSFAQGTNVEASGLWSHAEGYYARATGDYSHAEVSGVASSLQAHAEGSSTASGMTSHAEGGGTTASGDYSHSEGSSTIASGSYSHAEGTETKASSKSQHAGGEYNVVDTSGSSSTRGTFAEIIGNGTSDSARSNARALDWNGNEYLMGTLICGCDPGSTGGKRLVFNQDGTVTWEAVT